MAEALPLLLPLGEFAGRMGNRDVCATALLNAAIIPAQTSQELTRAHKLAVQALSLVDPLRRCGNDAQAHCVL